MSDLARVVDIQFEIIELQAGVIKELLLLLQEHITVRESDEFSRRADRAKELIASLCALR